MKFFLEIYSDPDSNKDEIDEEFNENLHHFIPELKEILSSMNKIINGVNSLIKSMRNLCPQLHFLSDMYILDILTNLDNPEKALQKAIVCYEGIHKILYEVCGGPTLPSPKKRIVINFCLI